MGLDRNCPSGVNRSWGGNVTLGHDPLDWYFELADRVHEKVVVRYIFEVPKGADIGKESDVIAGRIFDMAEALGEFAGYFVWEQTKLNPARGRVLR
jgi:hypothetical protein